MGQNAYNTIFYEFFTNLTHFWTVLTEFWGHAPVFLQFFSVNLFITSFYAKIIICMHIRLVENGVLLKSINFGILAIFSHFLAKRVNFWAYVTKSANGIVFFEFLILKLVYISREKLWTLKCTQNLLRSWSICNWSDLKLYEIWFHFWPPKKWVCHG